MGDSCDGGLVWWGTRVMGDLESYCISSVFWYSMKSGIVTLVNVAILAMDDRFERPSATLSPTETQRWLHHDYGWHLLYTLNRGKKLLNRGKKLLNRGKKLLNRGKKLLNRGKKFPRVTHLVTRSLGLVTRFLGLVTRSLGLVTRSLDLVTRSLDLVTRSLDLVTRSLDLVCT